MPGGGRVIPDLNTCHLGKCVDTMRSWPAEFVQTCFTSPPYWGLRDYGCEGQIGLEPSPEEYTAALVAVFQEVRRVLRPDGTLWLNLGDSYATGAGAGKVPGGGSQGVRWGANGGHWQPNRMKIPGLKPKDLVGIPWRVAFALQADGWTLRSDVIWHKPNPMPESIKDRPTKSHEYLFLLSKGPDYFYNADAIREPHADFRLNKQGSGRFSGQTAVPGGSRGVGRTDQAFDPNGRNKRSVWSVASQPFDGAHFAVCPPKLIEPCVLAGSRPGDVVLDPFFGSGTTGMVAQQLGRQWIACELNPAYLPIQAARTQAQGMAL